MATTRSCGFGRRSLLASAGAVAGSGAVTGFPTIWAQNIKNVTLRQFGTGVSNINEIAAKVKEDLGFTLEISALDSDAVVQRAVTQPRSYDVIDPEYWMLAKIVPSGNLQPMDTQKIKLFDKIVPIFTKGELGGKKIASQGTAPFKVSYLTGPDSKTCSKTPTRWFTLVPPIYNADTLGVRPDVVGKIDSWK